MFALLFVMANGLHRNLSNSHGSSWAFLCSEKAEEKGSHYYVQRISKKYVILGEPVSERLHSVPTCNLLAKH